MPRLNHVAQVPLGSIGDYSIPDAADLVFNDPGDEDMEETTLQRLQTFVVANNIGGGGAATFTLESVPNPFNRLGSKIGDPSQISYGLDVGEFAMFGPFDDTGWRQPNGKLNFIVSNAFVKIAVIRLPIRN